MRLFTALKRSANADKTALCCAGGVKLSREQTNGVGCGYVYPAALAGCADCLVGS